jgi:hypothetical protein
LVLSTIIVIAMILWDALTRRRKDKARFREKVRRMIADEEEDRRLKNTVLDLYDLDEEKSQVFAIDYPWDTAFNYKPVTFKTDSESTSSDEMSMNAIFEDLFSQKRILKNVKKLKKIAVHTTRKVMAKLNKDKDVAILDESAPSAPETVKISKMDKKTANEYLVVKKKIAKERKAQEERALEKSLTACYVRNVAEENRLREIEDKARIAEGEKIEPRVEKQYIEIPMMEAPKGFSLVPVEEKVEEKVEAPVEVKVEKKERVRRDAGVIAKKEYVLIEAPWEYYATPMDELTYVEEPEDCVVWDDDKKRTIRESSLGKLVELLTSPTYFDTSMQHTFMLTFRSFVDKEQLYKMLMERFNMGPPHGISSEEFSEWKVEKLDKTRLRIASSIKYWIENFYAFDFSGDDNMLGLVQESMKMMESINGGLTYSSVINRALNKVIDEEERVVETTPNFPEVLKPPKKSLFGRNKIKHPLLLWPSVEFARQLTLIEQHYFRMIQPKECLNQSWAKGQRETKAPGICAMVSRFNLVSMWVGTVVCTTTNMEERVQVVEKFIEIADALWNINNLNGVFTICSGLSLAPVFRLKKTWPQISEASKEKFDTLNKAIARDNNFSAIRSRIKNVKPPAMPYIGIYLTDLTFIEDGNPKYVNDKINFVKCKCFAGVIRDMQTYQNTKYEFAWEPELNEPLMELTHMTDGDMYKASLEIEPKAQKTKK